MRNRTGLLIELSLVILLALLAAHPFWSRPGLPRGTDAELHVFRAAELGYALRGGAGYVRWAPNFWYGYGYPIFNYYAPLTYYLANALAVLGGAEIVWGTKAIFVLGVMLAALGAFWLGRNLFGARAGLAAAAAYTFAPYLLLVDTHKRGDLPEFFALALFPWLLNAQFAYLKLENADQLSPSHNRPPSTFYFLLAACLWAALVLTHNLMALILSAILAAWGVWQCAAQRTGRARGAARLLKLTLAAAGLSAFFWLPFIAERGAVHLDVVGAGHYDFHNHFVAWRTLFAPSLPLDLGAASPRLQLNLGLGQWLLALPAIPLAFIHRRKPQGQVLLFFVLCSLFLIFLMLSPSTLIWENAPLMPYIQFPWRLLGPAALMLAMCIAGAISLSTFHLPLSALYPASCLLLLLALALPAMYPPLWPPDFGPTTPRGMLQVELEGRYLGTTSTGDFVPSTVKAHPPINQDLIASYDQGIVDKFDRGTLPPDASARVLEHGPTRDRFAVSSPQPFTARVLTFYFPGWQVQLDGQPISARPSDPHGLIEFDIPAGDHDVLVTFGSTLPRTTGAIISLLALAALALQIPKLQTSLAQLVSKLFRLPSQISNLQSSISNLKPAITQYTSEIIIIAAFILFKFAIADPCDTCFRYTSPPGQVWSAQHTLGAPVDFAHHIVLLGYDLPADQVRSGEKLALTLYWKATAPVPQNYQVFVHLIRPATTLWGQSDKLNPGDAPTTIWPLDKFVWDEHTMTVLPGAPPGEYQLSVGLYTLRDGARAPVLDAAGQIAGDSFALPVTIRVLPGRTRLSDLVMDEQDNLAYNGSTLLGHSIESGQVRAPGFARVTLFWQANQNAPPQPAQVTIALVGDKGQIAAHIESEPTGGIYPPARWQRGQIVRDIYSVWLDDQVTPGAYIVRLQVDNADPLDLAQIQVTSNE